MAKTKPKFDPITQANGNAATLPPPDANELETSPLAANGDESEPTDNHPTPTAIVAAVVVQLQAPMQHTEAGYATNHIQFQGMTNRQRAAAKRLFISLGRVGARIQMNGLGHPDGKVVNNYGDACRWVFERLADAFEAETGSDITEGMRLDG
jgi:hypothetical protein